MIVGPSRVLSCSVQTYAAGIAVLHPTLASSLQQAEKLG